MTVVGVAACLKVRVLGQRDRRTCTITTLATKWQWLLSLLGATSCACCSLLQQPVLTCLCTCCSADLEQVLFALSTAAAEGQQVASVQLSLYPALLHEVKQQQAIAGAAGWLPGHPADAAEQTAVVKIDDVKTWEVRKQFFLYAGDGSECRQAHKGRQMVMLLAGC